jgi:hypothetical protein
MIFIQKLVRPPGFEPGTLAWKAKILPGLTTVADQRIERKKLKPFLKLTGTMMYSFSWGNRYLWEIA